MNLAAPQALVHSGPEGRGQARCQAVGLSRSSSYYRPRGETALHLPLMRRLDEAYIRHRFKGVLGRRDYLRLQGYQVNEKRVRRLLRLLGLEAVSPKPCLSVPGQGSTPSPDRLRARSIRVPNEVWRTDIRSIPLARGFLYLVAVLDWHWRYVLSWELSNMLAVGFCLAARGGAPATGALPPPLRPGQPVHQHGLRAGAAAGRRPPPPRWAGPRPGQRLRRAALALAPGGGRLA